MVSRERLYRLGATVAGRATTKRLRIVAQLLLLAAILFVALRMRSLWHGSHVGFSRVNWPTLVAAAGVDAVAVGAAALVWLRILRRLGVQPRLRWTGIYLQAQLGKYIPGSVWQYAGRAALARAEAIPVRLATVSLTAELTGSTIAAGILGSLAGGRLAFGAVAGSTAAILAGWALVTRRFTRLRGAHSHPAIRAALETMLLYLPIWLLLGSCFWLTARSLFHVSFGQAGFYTGVFSLAWLVGLVAVFAPGGLGVREAVILALLRSRIGAADAVLLAAVSRGLLTAVDLLAGAVGAIVLRRSQPKRSDGGQLDDQSARWAKTTNPVP
jgi:uncharacterized membrane protein YbhN (UPF0104 family)